MIPPNYLNRFKVGKANEFKQICNECFEFFGRQIPYGRIAGMVRDVGKKHSRTILEEVKKANFPNRVALWLSRMSKERATFETSE